jgi:hypothetical protein
MTCYCLDKCNNPSVLIHSDVIVVGYEDPALIGDTITFSCPTGAIISGPNSSVCTGNGEWEPDPRKVECVHKRQLVATGTAIPSMFNLPSE